MVINTSFFIYKFGSGIYFIDCLLVVQIKKSKAKNNYRLSTIMILWFINYIKFIKTLKLSGKYFM